MAAKKNTIPGKTEKTEKVEKTGKKKKFDRADLYHDIEDENHSTTEKQRVF